MNSLVRGVYNPKGEILKRGLLIFPKPVELARQVVTASPLEVLEATLDKYYLASYKKFYPWMCPSINHHNYLHIDELDDGALLFLSKKDITGITGFLANNKFNPALRKSALSGEQKMELAEYLLNELNPKADDVSRHESKGDNEYSDILKQLGINISSEEIDKIIQSQSFNHDMYDLAWSVRQLSNYNDLDEEFNSIPA